MKSYPSLFARLTPDDVNGRRGATVTCTATLRPIGFIWWTCDAANVVTWHWRTGEQFGERVTERNAVQALRDVWNARGRHALPLGPPDVVSSTTTRLPGVVLSMTTPPPVPVHAPPAARAVVWGDTAAADLTAAVAAAFAQQHKDAK